MVVELREPGRAEAEPADVRRASSRRPSRCGPRRSGRRGGPDQSAACGSTRAAASGRTGWRCDSPARRACRALSRWMAWVRSTRSPSTWNSSTQRGGAADEQLPDRSPPSSGGRSRRSRCPGSRRRVGVVGAASLVPVVDVLFRYGRVVLPLGARGVGVEVVVDDVLDHGDAVRWHSRTKCLYSSRPPTARLDREVVGVAVSPAEGAGELGQRHQLDGGDPEPARWAAAPSRRPGCPGPFPG